MPSKGELNGECNWDDCKGCEGNANWWNRGSHAYYCSFHAELINLHNFKESPFPLCVPDLFGEKPRDDRRRGYICGSCRGENCKCGKQAVSKIEELLFNDDPYLNRHPLTAYVCADCLEKIMGSRPIGFPKEEGKDDSP